jgi:cellulose synthase/poly-beta-1,6-N-acetylglucosamine synthase-like glycosyltransferase
MSTSALARALGVNKSTILRAVRAGTLRPDRVTPGGHLRFLPGQQLQPSPGINLLTSTQVAARLGISRSTMARAVTAGRVRPAVTTPGGHHRFAADSLAELAGALHVPLPAPKPELRGAGPVPSEGVPQAVNRHLTGRLLIGLGALVALVPLVAFARGTFIAIQGGFSASTFGIALALAALLLGSFFFLYSVKYYLGTLVVLVSAVMLGNGNGHGNGHTNGNGHPHGLMRFVRRRNGNGHTNESGAGNGNGHFDLGYEPFVSIHIATYNEKRVIGRLLEACSTLEYENYEVIVVDDSTDETAAILQAWRGRPRFKIIHRPNRDGFKGGALAVALERTDPRAEFVIVWDADVVPFADSIKTFLPHFFRTNGHGESGNGGNGHGKHTPEPLPEVAAVQSYQWHVLNKSESWLTEAVRAEYAGSYMVERPFQQAIGSLKMVAGTAYMIRADLLKSLGWGRSLTEDWELTLRLYALGFKVVYTPYAESPAECVGTFSRLARQRMRWAEGHSYNVRRHFGRVMGSSRISVVEKVEFLFYATYYLQAAIFIGGTAAWLIAELFLHAHVPEWTAILGWSLLFTNLLSLPAMNMSGLLLEEAPAKDFVGVLGALATSFLLIPFQAYASVKGFIERDEGPWYRTPKTGRITDSVQHLRRLKWLLRWLGPPRSSRHGTLRVRAVGSAPRRPTSRIAWVVVGALVLALGSVGFGALHAPVVDAAGTSLFLHGASTFTMDTTTPVGAQQSMSMTAANATRTWTTTATSGAQTILSSATFVFNYSTVSAGTSTATLRFGYSTSSNCGVIALVQTGTNAVTAFSGNNTTTLPLASTAGNLLVITINGFPTNVFTAPAGWILAAGSSQTGRDEIWYYPNNPGGITSATLTSSNFSTIAQMTEWSGAAAAPLDRTGTNTDTGVISSTVSTSAATTTVGDLGITAFRTSHLGATFTVGAGWTNISGANGVGYESDYRLGLPVAVATETMTDTATGNWADAIATFLPNVTTIAKTTVTLTSGTGLATAAFSPAANVTVPSGSFLCFTVFVNSVTGGGLTLHYDSAATPTNLNSSQTITIPELVLPFFGLALLAPFAARIRRRRALNA